MSSSADEIAYYRDKIMELASQQPSGHRDNWDLGKDPGGCIGDNAADTKVIESVRNEVLEMLARLFPNAFKVATDESIDPDQIASIQKIRDISSARQAALDLAFANARSPERRADLRDQIRNAGTVDQLIKILWSMKLSNDGLKTGMGTVKTRKGIGYGSR